MFKIGIDASGGDFGEIEAVKAVISYIKKYNDVQFKVFGDEKNIINHFKESNFDYEKYSIEIIPTKDKIEMNDHPMIAIRTKTESSIVKAGNSLLNKEIDAFVSAGNTGALVALAQFYLKPIEGVDRPVLGAIVPTSKNPMLLLDSGCNVDSKPEWLYQYSLLANAYYKLMFNVERPSIGLLSVGTEENKGNNLTLETFKLISSNKDLNFIGNVEARDLPHGVCDITVTDGFAGNVFLKTYEGSVKLLLGLLKDCIKSSFISIIGGLLIKKSLKKVLKKYDQKQYGGAPILGTNYLVIKCHGNSKEDEFISTIIQAKTLLDKDFIKVIDKTFAR